MAIPDLPVWTIRPNWKGGILERLEWLTDVLTSDSGVEQRRAVRLSPRRSFEITVNPTDQDRTYLDLLLHRLGSEEWLFPLWHDQAALSAGAAEDDTRLDFDNTFREFLDDGFAILYRSTFEWEVVEISAQDEDGLDLAGALTKTWPRGTKVFPLRRALVQTDTSLKSLTSRVGESVLLFQMNEANDYAEAIGDAMVLYAGAPLLTVAPNRSREITLDHVRFSDEADGEVGLKYRTDRAGRAFAVQSHNWLVQGREAHSAFRSFLYALNGRQRMVWLPSFNDDLVLARPLAEDYNRVDVRRVGLSYVGGGSPIPGRATAWSGSQVFHIAGYAPALGPGEERLVLVENAEQTYQAGATWSFLEPARLNQDTIELTHYTDTDGTMECAASFQTFLNARDAAGSNFVPIPEAVMDDAPCGFPLGSNPCDSRPCSPSTLFFWNLEFNGCKEFYCPTRNWYMPAFNNGRPDMPHVVSTPIKYLNDDNVLVDGPAGVSMNTLSIVNNCNGIPTNIYEKDDFINPASPWYRNPLARKLRGQRILTASSQNGDFSIQIFGQNAMGGGQLQIQYGAFWCGDNVAQGTLTRTDYVPPDCGQVGPTVLIESGLVGNVPYTWVW